MASKLNSDAEGYDLVMFAYSGKTMIGKLYNYNKAGGVITNGSVIMTMLGMDNDGTANLGKLYDNYFIIDNPCQVIYDVVKQTTGTAKLTWKLVPYFYKNLVQGSSLSAATFAFPKQHVCLSNLTEGSINNKLIQAYKELVQITK